MGEGGTVDIEPADAETISIIAAPKAVVLVGSDRQPALAKIVGIYSEINIGDLFEVMIEVVQIVSHQIQLLRRGYQPGVVGRAGPALKNVSAKRQQNKQTQSYQA